MFLTQVLSYLSLRFMKAMCEKYLSYNLLRNANILNQLKIKKISYAKITFKYYGTCIWNIIQIN